MAYNITTDFSQKDSLPTGADGKIIRGNEFSTEFNNIRSEFISLSSQLSSLQATLSSINAEIAQIKIRLTSLENQ
jgi:chromosome segregation ATPase